MGAEDDFFSVGRPLRAGHVTLEVGEPSKLCHLGRLPKSRDCLRGSKRKRCAFRQESTADFLARGWLRKDLPRATTDEKDLFCKYCLGRNQRRKPDARQWARSLAAAISVRNSGDAKFHRAARFVQHGAVVGRVCEDDSRSSVVQAIPTAGPAKEVTREAASAKRAPYRPPHPPCCGRTCKPAGHRDVRMSGQLHACMTDYGEAAMTSSVAGDKRNIRLPAWPGTASAKAIHLPSGDQLIGAAVSYGT